jgi:hypothetical protein
VKSSRDLLLLFSMPQLLMLVNSRQL